MIKINITKYKHIITILFLILIGTSIINIFNVHIKEYVNCDKEFKNTELYMYKHYTSNISNNYVCKIGNRTEDKINAELKEKEQIEYNRIKKLNVDCYRNGSNYNYNFDLIKDYEFTCKQIEYINNHFIRIAEEHDGGTATKEFRSSTFFTSASDKVTIKLKDWVGVDKLPTDMLLKNISYHLDCKNSTLEANPRHDVQLCGVGCTTWNPDSYKRHDTTKIIYYTESDFVMYYVNNCID